MKNRFAALLLAGTILAPAVALADSDTSHLLDVGYATATRSGVANDVWSIGLASLFSYDHLNFQLAGDYQHINPADKGGAFDLWDGAADLFWRDHAGEFGLSANYGTVNPTGVSNKHMHSYGAFGEWYLQYDLTLRVKGGGFHGGGFNGWYSGTAGEFYIARDLGATVEYNYTSSPASHANDFDAGFEYLISHAYPLSLYVGYERASTRVLKSNAVLARLRYRFGAEGSLTTIDRSSPTEWDGTVPLASER